MGIADGIKFSDQLIQDRESILDYPGEPRVTIGSLEEGTRRVSVGSEDGMRPLEAG